MNVIACAIDRETAASARYEELAADAPRTELHELFTLLAAAEREHLQRLFALRKEMERLGAWEVAACPSKVLPGPETLASGTEVRSDGYVEVARAEEESIAFYERLAARAENPQLRRLGFELAAEERRHLQQIAHIYDFVEGPKTFLAWGEFANLREF